ncbi:hypothetical protein ACDG_01861 [Acidaminococcus intestini]|nr:hypothetical protein ACDG_01861 [Acidaminococcus intestini]
MGPNAVPRYAQHGVAKGEGPRKCWSIKGFTAKGSKNPAQHVGNWDLKLAEQEPDECSSNKNKIVKHKASPFLRHPAPQAAESFLSLIVPESQGMGKWGLGAMLTVLGAVRDKERGILPDASKRGRKENFLYFCCFTNRIT